MPVRPTYPGVYIEEVPSGVRTITGVATSIAAFIGFFKRGPMNKAVHILSPGDFEREFGGLDARSEASYAIQQFFLNGGTEAYVVRTASTEPCLPASLILNDVAGHPSLIITAKEPGAEGNKIKVEVTDPNSDAGVKFNLAIAEEPYNNLMATAESIGSITSGLVNVALAEGTPKRPAEISAPLASSAEGEKVTLTLKDAEDNASLIITATDVMASGESIKVTVVHEDTDKFKLQISRTYEKSGLKAESASINSTTYDWVDVTLAPGTPKRPAQISAPLASSAEGEKATLTLKDAEDNASLIITATDVMASGESIKVTVVHEDTDKFKLQISRTYEKSGLKAESVSINSTIYDWVDVTLAPGTPKRPAKTNNATPLLGGLDGPSCAQVTLQDDNGANVLIVKAANEGVWGNALRVEVDYATTDPTNLFNLTVSEYIESNGVLVPQAVETFINLGMEKGKSNCVDVVNDGSKWVQLSVPDPNNPPTTRPAQSGTTGGDIAQIFDALDTLDQKSTVNILVNGDLKGSFKLGKEPSSKRELLNLFQTKLRTEAKLAGASVEIIGNRIRVTLGGEAPDAMVVFADNDGKLAKSLKLDAGNAVASKQQYLLTRGCDGQPPGADEIIGSESQKQGLYALDDIDLFNLLCIPRLPKLWKEPESGAKKLVDEAIAYCEKRRAFMLVDIAEGVDEVQEMQDWVEDNATSLRKRNAALYFPLVKIADSLNAYRLRTVGCSGTIAGLYARTDSERGIWKAPAGIDATLRGVQGLDYKMTDAENGVLNPLGINCIRNFRTYGTVAWGARTLRGADQLADEYKYIPIRRLVLYIEESLYRGTQWVVFEPNDEPLWAQIRMNVGAFMHTLFRQGAFAGKSPKEAYLVKCDKETTTQDDVNRGIVNILVGFAPLKPAEFVIIKIQQLAGQNQA